MKYETYTLYDPARVALAESGFLTVWGGLGSWHDNLYTLLHYDKGTNSAVAAFADEVRLNNPACPDALRCLEHAFGSEAAPAPVKAAHFVLGQTTAGEHPDLRTRRLQIQQDMVDAGKLLRAALPAPAAG